MGNKVFIGCGTGGDKETMGALIDSQVKASLHHVTDSYQDKYEGF